MNVYVRELSRELGRQGCWVDVFTRAKLPGVPQIVQLGERARVIHIKAGQVAPYDRMLLPPHIPEFLEGVQGFVDRRHLRYHLIHSHYWVSGTAAQVLRSVWGVPVVHMSHTLGVVKNLAARCADEREPPRRIALEGEVLRSADCIVAATPLERAQLRWFYNVPEERVVVVPCGVNLSMFRPLPVAEARAKLGLADEGVVLYVGRIEPIKGLETLVHAFALCRREARSGPRLRLYVIGGNENGEEYAHNAALERLKGLVRVSGLGELVSFLGPLPQEELPTYYAAADVCVLPSRYESFGVVALESLACGTPVVASRVGGLPSIVEEGRTGFLVPPGHARALADRIMLPLRNPGLRARMGCQASHAVRRFDWRRIAGEILALYARWADPARDCRKQPLARQTYRASCPCVREDGK